MGSYTQLNNSRIGYQSSKCPNCGYSKMDYNSDPTQYQSSRYDEHIFRQHGLGITQMYKY